MRATSKQVWIKSVEMIQLLEFLSVNGRGQPLTCQQKLIFPP